MAGEEVRGGVVLLGCPFCGRAPRIGQHHRFPQPPTFYAECENVDCPMDTSIEISAWNRRAPAAEQDAEGVQIARMVLSEVEPLLEGAEPLPRGYAVKMAARLEKALAPIVAGAGEREGAK